MPKGDRLPPVVAKVWCGDPRCSFVVAVVLELAPGRYNVESRDRRINEQTGKLETVTSGVGFSLPLDAFFSETLTAGRLHCPHHGDLVVNEEALRAAANLGSRPGKVGKVVAGRDPV